MPRLYRIAPLELSRGDEWSVFRLLTKLAYLLQQRLYFLLAEITALICINSSEPCLKMPIRHAIFGTLDFLQYISNQFPPFVHFQDSCPVLVVLVPHVIYAPLYLLRKVVRAYGVEFGSTLGMIEEIFLFLHICQLPSNNGCVGWFGRLGHPIHFSESCSLQCISRLLISCVIL